MLGSVAAAAAFVIAATPAMPATVVGTVASVSALPDKIVLVMNAGSGTRTVDVATSAVVRERAAGETWHAATIASLSAGEPVTVRLDAAGDAVAIDAEYGIVDTRAVTMEGARFVGTDGIVRGFVGPAALVGRIPLGAYVELRIDPATGAAFDVAVSARPFANAGKAANAVAVTISVRVPVNTPASSTIYIATNAQNWTANAIRMSPEPGNVWTATVDMAAGTLFQYKFTRGSWTTGERDASGSEIPSRTLAVTSSSKTQVETDAVARWADLPS